MAEVATGLGAEEPTTAKEQPTTVPTDQTMAVTPGHPQTSPQNVTGVKPPSRAAPFDARFEHEVRRPTTYASAMVTSQEMMLENLRYMRRQLEKEDRELKIMQQTLYNRDLPRKSSYTLSNRNVEDLRGGSALLYISKRSQYK